MLHIPSGIRQS